MTNCSPLEVLRLDKVKVSARIDEVDQELAAAQQSGLAGTDSYLRDTLLELRKEKNELRKEKNELRKEKNELRKQETILLQANVPVRQEQHGQQETFDAVDSQEVMRVELTPECIASLSQGVASITLKNFMEPNVLIAVHDQWDKFANPMR